MGVSWICFCNAVLKLLTKNSLDIVPSDLEVGLYFSVQFSPYPTAELVVRATEKLKYYKREPH